MTEAISVFSRIFNLYSLFASLTIRPSQNANEQFLQDFEISRTFLRAKQERKKRVKSQNPVKIVHNAVVLIFLSL